MLDQYPGERPHTAVVHAVIGGKRCRLKLDIGALGEIETLCKAGIGEIIQRFGSERFSIADVVEPIRHGLIGGGECGAVEATAVIQTFVEPRLNAHVALATRLLVAACSGVDLMPAAPEAEAGNG